MGGAKFTARHPNLVALELLSFECGHDAPTFTVIEPLIEWSGTPAHGVTDFATTNVKDFQGLGFDRVWNPLAA